MTIPASAQGTPITPVNVGLPLVDTKSGLATRTAAAALQSLRNYIVNMNRAIPCSITGTNDLVLTLLDVQPAVSMYVDYECFIGAAENTSTDVVTASVVTATGTLAQLKVFKANGAQAGSGDITAGNLYRFYFNDAMDSGAGGLVLDPITITGISQVVVVPVSGTGDDTNINNNFTAIVTALNALLTAVGA